MNIIRRRLSAFFLDMLLVIIISVSLSNLSYLNPYKYKYENTVEEYNQVYDEFASSLLSGSSNAFLSTSEVNEYMEENIAPLIQKAEKYNIFYLLWYLGIYLLYFVLFAYFNNGQTLGKKLFKIKVVDKQDKSVSLIKLILRSIFNGSSLYLGLNITIILRILLTLVTNTQNYYSLYMVIRSLSFIFEASMIIIFLIKKGKISTNDLIAGTKVVEAS